MPSKDQKDLTWLTSCYVKTMQHDDLVKKHDLVKKLTSQMLLESDRDFKSPSPLQQSFDSSYPVMLRGDQSDMLQCYQLATNQVSL